MDSVCLICKGNDYICLSESDENYIPCPDCVQTEPTWEIPNESK